MVEVYDDIEQKQQDSELDGNMIEVEAYDNWFGHILLGIMFAGFVFVIMTVGATI
jgi:hypothetical protein